MPQPYVASTNPSNGASMSHHHSYSQSQAQFHFQGQTALSPPPAAHSLPYNNYPPRSSTSVTARYPPADVGSARADSIPYHSSSSSRSNTPINFSQRGPAANYHYNRNRSGTANSTTSSIGGGALTTTNGVSNNTPAGFRAEAAGSRFQSSSTRRPGDPTIREQVPRPNESLSQPARFADETPSSPAFFAGTLPRTSSLLPPPRIVGTNLAPVKFNAVVYDPNSPPDPLTNPQPLHSRGGSTGGVSGVSEGFRNLNRWSASTTSSRASHSVEPQLPAQPPLKVTTNFSRRMSVDSIGILNQSLESPQATFNSPRRLTKRRPSAASITSASPRAASSASNRRPSSPALAAPNLPPIITLPSLELSTASLANLTTQPLDQDQTSATTDTPGSLFTGDLSGDLLNQRQKRDEHTDPESNALTNSQTKSASAAAKLRDAMPERRGHSRSRSSTLQSSSDSGGRTKKHPSQKAMLSKALAKANTAVQLDNAQNFEGARISYIEACDLLAHVLARTTGDEDKKKLEAIRRTYTSRIEELDGMVHVQVQMESKALPARPESISYNGVEITTADSDEEDLSPTASRKPAPDYMGAGRFGGSSTNLAVDSVQGPPTSSFSSRSPMRRNFEGSLTIPQGQLMPAPLSPRRPASPAKPRTPDPEEVSRQDFFASNDRLSAESVNGHNRNPSHESVSWLDPIDESDGSEASSVHSRSSSFGVRRKHIRAISGDTEAEFDAALDAAVEAAYDDGFDPLDAYDEPPEEDVVANAMRRVEIAKERVRQTEREALSEREAVIKAAHERERQRQMSIAEHDDQQVYNGHFFDGSDSEEDERMLEDLTRDYALNNFSFNQQGSKQVEATSRERKSDSSGLTQRTYHSSVGSSPPTANTVLSSVAELPNYKGPPPSLPPPPQALPQIPSQSPGQSSVRSRRLSGQNAKQLKIETAKLVQAAGGASTATIPVKPGNFAAQSRGAMSATSTKPGPFSMRSPDSPRRGASPAPPLMAPPTPPHNPPHTEDPNDFRTGSPMSFGGPLRKNQSSSSLKSLKARQMSVPNLESPSDLYPLAPLSQTMTNSSISRQPAMPALPTPLAASFGSKAAGGFGGMFLFDSDFHAERPQSPNSIQSPNPDIPLPLEPCPSDVMLRPFWLMRALYQTLAHPRGGYVTTRLFVPHEVWKVKGVKLRNLEDKTSQCDFLTAALLNLARIDSNDADAVLEEMQSLENVLEQVQQILSRKLGNEVGTQSAGAFRDREDSEPAPPVPRSTSVSGKAAAFSWRRLRSKGSAANLTSAYGSKSTSGGGERIPEKEVLGVGSGTMPTLPMVPHPSSRPAKRDVHALKFDGPYAGYMQSLARLFDAAQTVDLIARQVDDPGLRHADKTQVGLELCTRHAAEFFSFYICRFVLADLGLLLDKFVKRGTEWVLM
ncbi:hypothetical protein G7054_g14821 [Neopestalotiopsis clavispora]|nr:hypothetical protein G7054_g14821 [Neopestalotiopsis clavispora]